MNILKSITEHFKQRRLERQKAEEEKEKADRLRWNAALEKVRYFNAHVNEYDGYVEYKGEDDSCSKDIDYTNSRNIAETVVYNRLKAKYGDMPIIVHTNDVPWPMCGITEYAGENSVFVNCKRIYYKAHEKNETCYFCENGKK